MLFKLSEVPGLPPVDLSQVLHGDSQSEIINHLPVEGSLLVDSTLVDVIDKGKFGLLVVQTDLWCHQRKTLFSKVFNSIIVRALGTFQEKIPSKFEHLVDLKCFGKDFNIDQGNSIQSWNYTTSLNQAIL